jgi:CBS domain containing-hemolysin-like protein
MGKKAKKQDFQKKSTSVKDQMKLKNKDKVKLNTKKIFVSTTVASSQLSDPDRIKTIIKHYKKGDSLVFQALTDTKTFFSSLSTSSTSLSYYLSLVYSDIFEVCFHPELPIRQKLKETIGFLCSKYDVSPLLSALPTIITCLCSGMSHVLKVKQG